MAKSVTTLANDPFDPATLYAGTEGGGVFKSAAGMGERLKLPLQ